MKITKTAAIALFAALGFNKAKGWDTKTLKERLGQLGEKVKEDKVPEDQKALFKQVTEAKDITVEDDAAEEEEEEVDVESLDSAGLKALIEERDLPIKGVNKKNIEVLRVEVKKALKRGGRKSSVDKAIDKKGKGKDKKEKKTKPPKDERPRDDFGCVEDSIRAKVNATLSEDYKSDEEVAEEAGVTLRQARIRLRRLTKKGILEKQSVIQYKLAKDWKKKLEASKAAAAEDNGDEEEED